MENWFIILCAFAVIGISLTSGLFLVFSDFLMRSFKNSKPAAGIEVMQVLNREIWKSITMVLLWGNLILTIGLASYTFSQDLEEVSTLLLLGAGYYAFGAFVLSFVANIPMNNKLDGMDFSSLQTASYWNQTYLPRWVFWNYLRAISTAIAAICFQTAILQM